MAVAAAIPGRTSNGSSTIGKFDIKAEYLATSSVNIGTFRPRHACCKVQEITKSTCTLPLGLQDKVTAERKVKKPLDPAIIPRIFLVVYVLLGSSFAIMCMHSLTNFGAVLRGVHRRSVPSPFRPSSQHNE
jgi:hypothetical protein